MHTLHTNFVKKSVQSCPERNIEGLILDHCCPASSHCIRSSQIGKILFSVTKSLNDHSKLVKMKFLSELGLGVFGANGIEEGHAVPNVEEREAVNTKIPQLGEPFVLAFRRYRKLSKSPPPLGLDISREVSSTSKDRKSVLKTLDGRSCGEIVRVCDVNEEI